MNQLAKSKLSPPGLKQSLKIMLIQELNLVDVNPWEIEDDDPLFGDKFGLDSIDAVEVVFQIKAHFGVVIRDMKEGRKVLQSINTLSEFIEKHRAA
ncbi:MAG: phosphopantetheine-binding protein [Thermodesulfobacteriota bacterium]